MARSIRQRDERGFTMVELMISVALLSIVTIYLLDSFTANQKAYVVVDQVTEAQQSTRAIGDLLERDIRHAGFMVPAQAAICGIDNINTVDQLYLSDSAALNPGATLSATLGAAFTIGGNTVSNGVNGPLDLDSVVLDGDPTYDTNGDGIKDADFQLRFGVIIADRADPGRGSACGIVTAVNPGANRITVDIDSPALGPFLGGTADLIAVPANEYRLNGMQLLRNGMALVQDVEDLQFAVLIDDNDNFQEDVGEYRGDGNAPDYLAFENGVDPADLREVRVTVVVRTRLPDQQFSDGQFQAAENRLAVAGNDGYRRRVHTSTSRLRNVMNRTAQ